MIVRSVDTSSTKAKRKYQELGKKKERLNTPSKRVNQNKLNYLKKNMKKHRRWSIGYRKI
jgi:hypothetical protein